MKGIAHEKVVYRYPVELVTMADIRAFVSIATRLEGKLLLCSGKEFQINAQSMLGVILAKKLNWSRLELVTERDYYNEFKEFIVD